MKPDWFLFTKPDIKCYVCLQIWGEIHASKQNFSRHIFTGP